MDDSVVNDGWLLLQDYGIMSFESFWDIMAFIGTVLIALIVLLVIFIKIAQFRYRRKERKREKQEQKELECTEKNDCEKK